MCVFKLISSFKNETLINYTGFAELLKVPANFNSSRLKSPHILECTAPSGKPLPEFEWSFNGKILDATSNIGAIHVHIVTFLR